MTITYTSLEKSLPRLKEFLQNTFSENKEPVEITLRTLTGLDHFYTDGMTVGCMACMYIKHGKCLEQLYITHEGSLKGYLSIEYKKCVSDFLLVLKDEQGSGTTSAQ